LKEIVLFPIDFSGHHQKHLESEDSLGSIMNSFVYTSFVWFSKVIHWSSRTKGPSRI